MHTAACRIEKEEWRVPCIGETQGASRFRFEVSSKAAAWVHAAYKGSFQFPVTSSQKPFWKLGSGIWELPFDLPRDLVGYGHKKRRPGVSPASL
jgi:hypothetical protein